jgi:cell division protein FtsZ
VNEAAEIIQSASASDSNIIFGAVIDEDLDDELRVTVIATGFEEAGGAPPVFEIEEEPLRRSATRRTPVLDEGQRSSLEIPDDEIDVPSFLKD